MAKLKKLKKSKIEVVNLGKKGKFTVRRGALHRALGISEDKPLGRARIKKAEHSDNPRIRRMARSAAGLTAME